jgi:hypothetical protein
LEERFNYLPPENCNFIEFGKFKKEKLNKIRVRITQTIKYWIENFFMFDFVEKESIDLLNNFIEMVKNSNELNYSKILLNTINNISNNENNIKNNKFIEYPKTLIPKKSFFYNYRVSKRIPNLVLNWDSIEIARQITLIEFEIFKNIEPNEVIFIFLLQVFRFQLEY